MYLYADGWPLAVRLNEIRSPEAMGILQLPENDPTRIAIMMAACLMFVLPIMVMYMFLQKKFVKSIDRVGITG